MFLTKITQSAYPKEMPEMQAPAREKKTYLPILVS